MKLSIIFRRHKWLTGLIVAIFWLLVWEGLYLAVGEGLLVPSPAAAAAALWALCAKGSFWHAAGITLLRIVLGFLAGVVTGCLLALLTTRFALARALLAPLLHLIRSAPVASFIILAMLWLQRGTLPVFISFLMVVPVIWGNVQQGIEQTDPKLLEMGRVFHLNRWTLFCKIRFPAVAPYLLAACTTSLGFAWKSGIAAEILCLPQVSLGKLLQDAKIYLETPQVFALTTVVILLSLLLERLLKLAAGRLGRRYNLKGGSAI